MAFREVRFVNNQKGRTHTLRDKSRGTPSVPTSTFSETKGPQVRSLWVLSVSVRLPFSHVPPVLRSREKREETLRKGPDRGGLDRLLQNVQNIKKESLQKGLVGRISSL